MEKMLQISTSQLDVLRVLIEDTEYSILALSNDRSKFRLVRQMVFWNSETVMRSTANRLIDDGLIEKIPETRTGYDVYRISKLGRRVYRDAIRKRYRLKIDL